MINMKDFNKMLEKKKKPKKLTFVSNLEGIEAEIIIEEKKKTVVIDFGEKLTEIRPEIFVEQSGKLTVILHELEN